MIPFSCETFSARVYKLKQNSSYEYDDNYVCEFRCKPVGKSEVKSYRLQKGVHGTSDSLFIMCSNVPDVVSVDDQVEFCGKRWSIKSIGYFFDENLIINGEIMSAEYIYNRCPKGIEIG